MNSELGISITYCIHCFDKCACDMSMKVFIPSIYVDTEVLIDKGVLCLQSLSNDSGKNRE
jgi:hypothetical protein